MTSQAHVVQTSKSQYRIARTVLMKLEVIGQIHELISHEQKDARVASDGSPLKMHDARV